MDPFNGWTETSTFRLGTKAAARATPQTAATPTKMRDDRRAGPPTGSVAAELEELTSKPLPESFPLAELLPFAELLPLAESLPLPEDEVELESVVDDEDPEASAAGLCGLGLCGLLPNSTQEMMKTGESVRGFVFAKEKPWNVNDNGSTRTYFF